MCIFYVKSKKIKKKHDNIKKVIKKKKYAMELVKKI